MPSKIAVLLLALLAFSNANSAVYFYGDEPVDNRQFANAAPGNLLINTHDVVTVAGYVSDWKAFGHIPVRGGTGAQQSGAGTVAQVIFTPNGGGSYTITGVSFQTLVEGFNDFINPVYQGSNNVAVGSLFGIWQGTGSISQTNDGVSGEAWGKNNIPGNNYLDTSLLGLNVASISNFATPRSYSELVTVQVPEPSTALMMGSVLAGWIGFASRKKQKSFA
jgi:hypothetical protein